MRTNTAGNLALFLGGAGLSHFVRPQFYDDLVPRALPFHPRFWVNLSGVAELAVAATVAFRPTRRIGGALAAGLFVVIFPGNVQMAWDFRHRSLLERAGAYGRLPLQIPLVVWALRVRAEADGLRPQGDALPRLPA